MTMIAQAAGYNKHMETFQRVHNINILVDLVVWGSRRARENATIALLNLVKSNGENTMGDIREVDKAEVAMRALVVGDSRVSAREKSMVEMLLRIM
ncbi:unnamed protein product [Musa hybrid cultivar]